MGEDDAETDDEEVERPDAQDAAQVEVAERDVAGLLPLLEQKRRDEKGAEGEEEIDAGGAGLDHATPEPGEREVQAAVECGLVRERVREEDAEKGVEADAIELRPVEPSWSTDDRRCGPVESFHGLAHRILLRGTG